MWGIFITFVGMKYFMIAGEASGDIHGSQLIEAIKRHDQEAQFCFLGGDLMAQAAGRAPLIHYRDMAFMGFVEVMKHLGSILGFMKRAKQAILEFAPHAVVLIDYPSFNLKMAKFAKAHGVPVFYFISPKVWAWKEWRVARIKRYVTRVYSILPFEVEFYRRHHYEVDYVGNPTVKEIAQASEQFGTFGDFASRNGLDPSRPLIALVPGSRRKEIADNLPVMVEAATQFSHYQLAIAGAPGIDASLYGTVLAPLGVEVTIVRGQSFELVHHARVALVTSGTATLEAAILQTPQVACYRMNGSKWLYRFYRRLLHGNYVTLPNLIADEAIIPELLLHHCTSESIGKWLSDLLPSSPRRTAMLDGYHRVAERLTQKDCTDATARNIIAYLNEQQN